MADGRENSLTYAERPYLLLFLGWLGILGCIALIVGTIIAPFFVPNHDWVADTISDLAAGPSEIVMDVSLYAFAAGLAATALAASHAHLGGVGWSAGILSLAILSALVIIIGARNEYGDGDADGVVIHIYLVYGLGLFFLAAPLLMASGIGPDHTWAKQALIGLAILWALASPVFLFLPTSVDGLYERALGIISCGIIVVLCAVFITRGRHAQAARS